MGLFKLYFSFATNKSDYFLSLMVRATILFFAKLLNVNKHGTPCLCYTEQMFCFFRSLFRECAYNINVRQNGGLRTLKWWVSPMERVCSSSTKNAQQIESWDFLQMLTLSITDIDYCAKKRLLTGEVLQRMYPRCPPGYEAMYETA